jgi:hypothetical protein
MKKCSDRRTFRFPFFLCILLQVLMIKPETISTWTKQNLLNASNIASQHVWSWVLFLILVIKVSSPSLGSSLRLWVKPTVAGQLPLCIIRIGPLIIGIYCNNYDLILVSWPCHRWELDAGFSLRRRGWHFGFVSCEIRGGRNGSVVGHFQNCSVVSC